MFIRRLMGSYILVKKSTVMLAILAAAGLVGYHFYKHHRAELKRDFDQFTDDITDAAKDVAKKGARQVKEVMDEVKS